MYINNPYNAEIILYKPCTPKGFLHLGPLGIVVPFVRRRRRRRRRTHSFGYYTDMVQQIKFIIHTNIQPLPALFLPKVKVIGQRSRSKI